MNMVKTLDKQITISHAQRADAPQGKIFKLQEYQKKRINKWIGSDSLEHYGDETQYIVEAIADTIYAFRGSSECLRPVGSGGLYFYPQAVTTSLPPSVSHPFL